MRDIASGSDIIDVRDIIERVEELESAKEDAEAEGKEMDSDEYAELMTLASLLDDVRGCGGDEQWRGDWYPITLIRDAYFETAMDELLEDIGEIPKNLPSYLKITIDYDALQMDYSSVEYDGETYWYR